MSELKHTNRTKSKLGYVDPTVAGIDIGSKLIHVSIPQKDGGVKVVEYGSLTPDLHKIAQTLKKAGVKTAVMEATGVYWIPLYETLESPEYGINPVLVDAKSVKNVPGRKTDIVDAQWIQVLYSSGLLRAAYRPPRDRITIRSLVRLRQSVIKNRQRALLHIEKVLQLMNLKLSSAVSDIAGISGMAIIRAIVAGVRDPSELAKLRHSTCKSPEKKFIDALTGNYQDDHLFALNLALEQYDFSFSQLEKIDERLFQEFEKLPDVTCETPPIREKDKKSNGKYAKARKPLKNSYSFDVQDVLWRKSGIDFTAIPGIEVGSALIIFAELGGVDVGAWESEKEFASWLKLCPGNNISGGKRRKSKHQPCVNPISQVLRLCAVSCKRSQSGLGSFIRRVCSRADNPKGIKAGAHKIARTLYQMCKHGMQYVEKGEAYHEKRHEERILKNLRHRAKSLGYELQPVCAG